MKYILIFDYEKICEQLFDINSECNPSSVEYVEMVIFYQPLTANFGKNITPLAVNSFLISSPLETSQLLEKIKSIAMVGGLLRSGVLRCQIYLSQIEDISYFTSLKKENEINKVINNDI